MNDERLDRLIRASLGWQAERAANQQPQLRVATHKLASRLQPTAAALRPRTRATAASMSAANLLVLLLLLLLLLGTVMFIGAQLLRETSPAPAGFLGYATDCAQFRYYGVAAEVFGQDDSSITVHTDGRLVRWEEDVESGEDAGQLGREAFIEQFEAAHRVLSPRGVELLLERIEDAGLTPGCRVLRTEQAAGQILAETRHGPVQVTWSPTAGWGDLARQASAAEEESLAELADSLLRPETWLPDQAWVERNEMRLQPTSWLVVAEFLPVSDDSGDGPHPAPDPRLALLQLPGDAEIWTFGEELPLSGSVGPGSWARCATVTRDEALLLARSMDAAGLGNTEVSDEFSAQLFSPDRSVAISISLLPAYPEGYDCAAFADGSLWEAEHMLAPPASEPHGDLAQVDPCQLLPDGVAQAHFGADIESEYRSRVAFDVPARACAFLASEFGGLPSVEDEHLVYARSGQRGAVSVYPRRVSAEEAGRLAGAVLGDGTVERPIGGWLAWENSCLAADLPCVGAIAAWSAERLLVFQFEYVDPKINLYETAEPITRQMARDFVVEVLENLSD